MSAPTVSPFHFLHRWTRWSEPREVTYRKPRFVGTFADSYTFTTLTFDTSGGRPDDLLSYTVTRVEQERDCLTCGAHETRRV